MFNVGGMELVVIALVAMVVLGPTKLSGAFRQLGGFMGEMQRMSQGLKTDLKGAMAEAERDAQAARIVPAVGTTDGATDDVTGA